MPVLGRDDPASGADVEYRRCIILVGQNPSSRNFDQSFDQSLSDARHDAMAAPLIWINGFPGTGKLTIARELAGLDERIKVIDNHQLIDPVEARFPRSHPQYQAARKEERARVFAKWVLGEEHLGHTIVFTGRYSSFAVTVTAGFSADLGLAQISKARPMVDRKLLENMKRLHASPAVRFSLCICRATRKSTSNGRRARNAATAVRQS